MLNLVLIIAGCSLATLLIVMALQWAYNQGVRDTGERWSEAVRRKESDDFRAGFERGRQEKCH